MARRQSPSAHRARTLLAEAAQLRPGLALDAGAGHGSETLWLATRGWRATAVDFSATAIGHARATAERLGPDVAGRIEWVEADLSSWSPSPARYDLVTCLYVHVPGSVPELVRRLGAGVASGGTLLLVGHRPVDPATGAPTFAAAADGGTGVDAVVLATAWQGVPTTTASLRRGFN